ncbi:hypothetical protein M426DRAFT_265523 [Hypoxylon sp. CI-4A]|nr:hypothetical protein M426DRAFT_265523 [Hypoxylon sp. CI-4A]
MRSTMIETNKGIHMEKVFTEEERARFEEWSSPLTMPMMGLAKWLPNIDPAALMQFAESPRVHFAYLEFERDFWSNATVGFRSTKPRIIQMKEFEDAVVLFELAPHMEMSSVKNVADKSDWEPRHHIVQFMRRAHLCALQDRSLSIRKWILNENERITILLGTLAAFIRACQRDRQFLRAPPSLKGDEEVSHLEVNHDDPVYFAMHLEWLTRHDPNDPDALARVQYFAHDIAKLCQEEQYEMNRTNDIDWFKEFMDYAIDGFKISQIPLSGLGDYWWQSDLGGFGMAGPAVANEDENKDESKDGDNPYEITSFLTGSTTSELCGAGYFMRW